MQGESSTTPSMPQTGLMGALNSARDTVVGSATSAGNSVTSAANTAGQAVTNAATSVTDTARSAVSGIGSSLGLGGGTAAPAATQEVPVNAAEALAPITVSAEQCHVICQFIYTAASCCRTVAAAP